jgi:cytochrome c oxidase subunit 1/cytochrome c oxidase subunit I+III
VYIIFLPAVGIVSSIVPVFSQRRIIGYLWLALATMVTAVIGFGVWVHHMFAVGLPSTSMAFFSAASLLITIPSGIQMMAWLATVIAGKPVLKTAFLFVLGFFFVFVIGGVTGVMFASVPFDTAITDSYFVVAHFHYVLFGGSVFPIFAAMYYWFPKIYGRLMDERLGTISFWLILVGFNLTFFPMHISGILGMPRRIYTYHAGLGWDLWNLLSSIGSYVLAAGILVTLGNWVLSCGLRRGAPAGPDPWNGESLEWATSSPPLAYNFREIHIVKSPEPLWDQPELREGAVHIQELTLAADHETLGTTVLDAQPEAIIPMPETSYTPVVTALGIALVFTGILTTFVAVSVAGALVTVAGLLAWFRWHGGGAVAG